MMTCKPLNLFVHSLRMFTSVVVLSLMSPAAHADINCGSGVGTDVIVGDVAGVSNYSSFNGIEAFAIGTTSCNVGDQNLLWIPDVNQHPVIAQNMYRLKDGRIEQIGISWLKHGFAALTDNFCGCGCQDPDNSERLGVGCSDPYSSGLNGSQDQFCGFGPCEGGLGPRFEVNAFTGEYPYPYSMPGAGNSIYKRLQVKISDFDPAQDGGGVYFAEGQYVTPDDAAAGNQDNNASYRQVFVSGSGSAWTVVTSGPVPTQQCKPAIRAWKVSDPAVTEVDVRVPAEGLFILAANATDLGGGTWHYEYALHNLNSHRSGQSFSVPIPPGVTVSNVGFHDVDYHSGEPYDGTDWGTTDPATGTLTWSTDDFATNSDANALRWGTLYNFRFDADRPPVSADITLTLFRPGSPNSVLVTAIGPASPADLDGDGDVDLDDLDTLVNCVNGPQVATPPVGCNSGDFANADLDGDNDVDLEDFQQFANGFTG